MISAITSRASTEAPSPRASRALLPRAAWTLLPIALARSSGLAFGPLNIDECDFVIIGRLLGRGTLPYVGIVEKKPLLAYLFYAPAALTGYELWPMQLAAIAWVFCTCLVVGRAAREWTGREEVGRAGAWLACLVQIACVPAVNLETMLNLPAALALLGYVRAQRSGRIRDAAATGLSIGIASLFKQQAGILLIAFGAALAALRTPGPPRIARVAALVAGVGAPWLAAAGLYAALGHLDAFLEWNVYRNLGYGAHGAGSAWARLAGGLAVGIALAAPVPWWLAARESARLLRAPRRDPAGTGLSLALWLTFVPVSLGGRFYDHYFLQFAPVLALLAAPGAARLAQAWPALGTAQRRLLGAALALPVAVFLAVSFGAGLLGLLPAQEPRTRELASWLERHSAPEERLFVWGHYTPIYVLADRLPGTRYYATAVHVGDFDPHHLPDGFDLTPFVSARDVALTLEDLERNRPAWFVDTAPADIHDWHRVPLAIVPELKRYLEAHYALVATPGGAAVYRRR